MKLRFLLLAALVLPAVCTSRSQAAPASVAGRPLLWSVHLDVNRARAGTGLELVAGLDANHIPALIASAEQKSGGLGGKLESVSLYGFQPPKERRAEVPVLANLNFSTQGDGISTRFEAIREKRGLAAETIAGYPTLNFVHQGKEVWVAKAGDYQVIVAASRELLESALKPETGGPAGLRPSPGNARDLLGGSVEIKDLPVNDATLRKSELWKMLSRLEFHFDADGKQLNLNAVAEFGDDRAAKRASRMIEGMMAALAVEDKSGVPWDERLVLGQDGSRLLMQIYLAPREAKTLLERASGEVKAAGAGK